MSSNNFVRLLRNSTRYATHDSALSNLQTKLATLADGEVAIASYGSDWATAKSILGVVRVKDGVHSYTIYDNEASSQEIATAIANLDANETGTSTDNHVTVNVVESNGLITSVTVTTNDIASAQALTNEIARAKEAEEANANAIAAETNRATAAEQTNANAITAETNRATAAEQANATAIATEKTRAEGKEAELLEKIEEVKGNAAKYKVVALTAEEIAVLEGGANVKEAYKVMSYTGDWDTATDKAQVGETIKIYKDSTLESASFNNEILTLVYILANGDKQTVNVDMKSLVSETEVKNGIALDSADKKLYVKLDSDSESFLTVGADGVKLSGVQNAIDAEKDRALAAEKVNADAIKTLNDEVIKNEKVTAASLIKIANASGVVGADDVIGYQKKTDANYIGDATSVHDATVKLDAQLKTVADSVKTLGGEALKKVNGSNAITVSEKDSNNEQTVSIKLDGATDNALQITENGLYISNVWDCGEY